VDDDGGTAKITLDGGRHGLDLREIRHVAPISLRARQLRFKRGQTLLVAREKRHAIAAFRESPRKRRTRPGTDT
jgi:hypothetical protein